MAVMEKKYCKNCGKQLVDNIVSYDEYTGAPIVAGKRCEDRACPFFSRHRELSESYGGIYNGRTEW